MAIGKNKGINKSGKRGGKRGKAVETMARKEWYDVVAPTNFEVRQFCKTISNKTMGTRIAAELIKGRVFETNMSDLSTPSENTFKATNEEAYRNVRFVVDDVQGRNLLTQFHSMSITTDRVFSLMRKWCTTMETTVDVKTADGYILRLFVVAFTKKQEGQLSRNCYAKQHLVKWVRHRINKVVNQRLNRVKINEAVNQITRDTLADALAARCNPIVPIRDLRIRKVKVIYFPKSDAQTIANAHGEIPVSKEADERQVEEAVEVAAE
ncbi:small subunit ribosomal protein S3Ae [Angomonas deanei]|uniref:Small ribosomal subunit protein eS1 n=1 Tax=Angomonas deanei TaxID=59799 RepID=S9VDQ1_9TRYP|nr:small subunit ribosomal protein S3Ae [Angomonas deanei]EPY27109.1 small subunit ribosomal protein S3Ae [Angomonas deanei]EPY38278.1 small subunit ribosomal protein S3Ae [Angomonas deanei]EPY38958.1 small subunit ribosomal protein S3Ae [Angomonas deanei]CAD2214641.1 Ribosomal S3Ae family, putative [Angomonas deanei]|eukprot:EPY24432.1 small subunit ribosomal protein S3Ae [Angomonas deanei]